MDDDQTKSYGNEVLTLGGKLSKGELRKLDVPKLGPADVVNVEEKYAVYPGAGVNVKVETNGLLDENETRAAVEKRLQACGFKIDPSSKLTLVASCAVAREETFQFGSVDVTKPLRPHEKREAEGEVTLKIFEEKAAFVFDGKTVWESAKETTGPDMIRADSDKSTEESFQEVNRPEGKFFEVVSFPRYVDKNAEASKKVGVRDNNKIPGRPERPKK